MNLHVRTNSEGTLMFNIPRKVTAEFAISRTLLDTYDLLNRAAKQYQHHTTLKVLQGQVKPPRITGHPIITNVVGASKPTPTSASPRSNTDKESNNASSAKDVKGQDGASFKHQRN
ncbi:hypothetical protein BGX30_009140, partial [Mortierella sp. GBA39]